MRLGELDGDIVDREAIVAVEAGRREPLVGKRKKCTVVVKREMLKYLRRTNKNMEVVWREKI